MRPVVDRLQGFAPEPPGCVAVCRRVRLGPGATRRSSVVPDVAQSLSWICGPKRDQLQTADVTGESVCGPPACLLKYSSLPAKPNP